MFTHENHLSRFTFGLASLKTTTAVETTNEISPSVSAFHAFNAINANANGNKTVVLNFNPSKNGTNTFLTSPRPKRKKIFVKKKKNRFYLFFQKQRTFINISFFQWNMHAVWNKTIQC